MWSMWKKLNKNTRKNTITYLIVIITFIIVQILSQAGRLSNLISGMLVLLCVYAIMAVSLNLTVGILGELSLGHAGFMCIGAFTSAFFTQWCEVNTSMPEELRFFLAILVGVLFAGIFGLLIGIPVLRLKGDYLAIVTLAFGEIIKNICNALYVGTDASGLHFSLKDKASLNMDGGTVIINGAQGITRTPRQSTFAIGIILLLISLIIVLNFINSRTGRSVMAIRDNRIAAESIGIPITKYKLMAFSLSAAIAGAAGALYAHNTSSLMATSAKFGYNMSIMFLVFVVLGGIGSMRGSVIAAVLLTVLPEVLRFADDKRMLIYAIVLIVMMLWNWAPAAKDFREQMKSRIKPLLKQKAALAASDAETMAVSTDQTKEEE